MMLVLMEGFPLYGILLMSLGVYGQDQILSKYMRPIQNYIMVGLENSWQPCDILSAGGYAHEDEPHITIDLKTIEIMNLKSVFSSSTCVLVKYDITSEERLSTLLEIGKKAINHIRLALVIKISPGVSLEKARNTSNLGYMIAAESGQGLAQYLCPVIGEIQPRLEHGMCNPSYLDYKNKVIRIGLMGLPPHFGFTSSGTIEGVNVRLTKMMAEGLNFRPDIRIAKSFTATAEQVCFIHLHNIKLSCGS